MGKIVYHGTMSQEPPHEYGEPFHVGTERAAEQRLDDEIEHGNFWAEEPLRIASMHAYEISDTAPKSRKMWKDPTRYEGEPAAVPEHKENRIYPYKNAIEHKGSTSYVVPSSFVGKHVKHLGLQFQHFVADDPDDIDTALGAISVMVGGRFKQD